MKCPSKAGCLPASVCVYSLSVPYRRATNAGGLGPVSAEISAAPVAPPAAPTGLAAAPGDGQIALSWNAVPGAALYHGGALGTDKNGT